MAACERTGFGHNQIYQENPRQNVTAQLMANYFKHSASLMKNQSTPYKYLFTQHI